MYCIRVYMYCVTWREKWLTVVNKWSRGKWPLPPPCQLFCLRASDTKRSAVYCPIILLQTSKMISYWDTFYQKWNCELWRQWKECIFRYVTNEFSETDLVELCPLKGGLTLVLAHKKVLKVKMFIGLFV